jgi:hypothetical protein
VLAEKNVCPYHEARGQLAQEHGERIAVVEVEVEHMKEAQSSLVERFEKAAGANEIAIKEMCAEVKRINLRLASIFNVPEDSRKKIPAEATPNEAVSAGEKEILEKEPIGWLNTALKNLFKNPVFWAIVAWALLKVFVFGEYPWFTDKVRPYMKPAVEMQTKK